MTVRYEEVPVTLADGTVVSLRRPTYGVDDPAYGPLHPDVMLSPRVAPQMIGLGLLEAIPAAEILARADPGMPMATGFRAARTS
ncbi:di-heme oxidoredictase family protein [Gemmobacter lanyuensis]